MMKYFFVAVAVVLCAVSLVEAQQPSNSSEKEVQAAESDWISLMLKPDAPTYNRLVADDFLQNNQFGISLNKARYSDTIVGSHLKFDSYTTSEVLIRVYGDTGVVTGIETTNGNLDGADSRFTRIYVKKQGRWQIVNNQLSNMQ